MGIAPFVTGALAAYSIYSAWTVWEYPELAIILIIFALVFIGLTIILLASDERWGWT